MARYSGFIRRNQHPIARDIGAVATELARITMTGKHRSGDETRGLAILRYAALNEYPFLGTSLPTPSAFDKARRRARVK